MLDLLENLVHLRWLLKLIDFKATDELSWGFVVLATLYWEMCEATPPNKAKIRGWLSLLQSWARFCFLFLRPQVNHPYTFSLIMRWNHLASYVRIPTALEYIQLLLDQRSEAYFQWTPYKDLVIWVVISDEFFQNSNIWHVKVPSVNYATIEMHQMNRVLRLECTTWCISFLDDSDSTDDIYAIVIRRIVRGTVGELISFPIPIAL
ncbi:hypothetical protein J1N35_007930 [Gossypium stocksii]|uniref:Aminotransferase-like plant mobile domain-containing protein n=1 Tax=Gossypium stocksii TaxID=47602 RepID=A0A9D4ADX4_9ROSI|nr:hypothetical protein J1N35_007930 [Gossypium stocksii]